VKPIKSKYLTQAFVKAHYPYRVTVAMTVAKLSVISAWAVERDIEYVVRIVDPTFFTPTWNKWRSSASHVPYSSLSREADVEFCFAEGESALLFKLTF
jgi:hypothetical protein